MPNAGPGNDTRKDGPIHGDVSNADEDFVPPY